MMEQNIVLLRQHCYQLRVFVCVCMLFSYMYFLCFLKWKMVPDGRIALRSIHKQSNKAPSLCSLLLLLHFLFCSTVRCPRLGWFIVFIYYSVKAAPILSTLFATRTICVCVLSVFFLSPSSGPIDRQCFRSAIEKKYTNSRIHLIASNTAIHFKFWNKNENNAQNHKRPMHELWATHQKYTQQFMFQ